MFGGLGAAGGDWHQARPLLGPPRLGLGAPSSVPVLLGSDRVWGRVWPCGSLGAFPARRWKGRLWEREQLHFPSLPPSRGTARNPSGARCHPAAPQPAATARQDICKPWGSRRDDSPREGRDWLRASGFSSSFPRPASRPPWRVLQQPRAETF